jgi:NTE family protein
MTSIAGAPPAERAGLGLALSGGGFRATLFHLGALRRLDELGILTRLTAISSVSGGSIMAAALADAMIASPPQPGQRMANLDAMISRVHDLTSCNLHRRVLLERIEPTNWHTTLAELVAKELSKRITDKPLSALPASPNFIFCATDMAFGVSWEYTRTRAGDYQAGYSTQTLGTIPIAHAAAASACFPPLFEPIETMVDPSALTAGAATGTEADLCRTRIRLTDGGVYDNMGLEPLWKNVKTLLVSDAGGDFEYSADRGTIADIKRYPDIVGNQARALRKRWLMASFASGSAGPGGAPGLEGTYWATEDWRSKYDPGDTTGYSAPVADLISRIRTDLDVFSPGETAALENHGYLMADVAIKTWVPSLYGAVPLRVPYPEFMDEAKVRAALKGSERQRLL